MSIRQPDDCLCFQGKCWRKFCPDNDRKKVWHSREKVDKEHKGKILTLSESKRKYLGDKNGEEESDK